MWYWLFKCILLGPFLICLGRPKVNGLKYIPKSRSAVLASNHLAVVDSLYLPLAVKRRHITFLAKQEHFSGTGFKGHLLVWFYTLAGQLPIDRGNSSSSQLSLEVAMRILFKGNLVGLYPEGTRSPDGKLYKGKVGLAKLILKTKVPIIPVAMIGTNLVNSPSKKRLQFRNIRVKFGRPIKFKALYNMIDDNFIERAIVDEVMYTLKSLSGQEYIDFYAFKSKV